MIEGGHKDGTDEGAKGERLVSTRTGGLATKSAREERSTGARRNDTPATGATNTHEC